MKSDHWCSPGVISKSYSNIRKVRCCWAKAWLDVWYGWDWNHRYRILYAIRSGNHCPLEKMGKSLLFLGVWPMKLMLASLKWTWPSGSVMQKLELPRWMDEVYKSTCSLVIFPLNHVCWRLRELIALSFGVCPWIFLEVWMKNQATWSHSKLNLCCFYGHMMSISILIPPRLVFLRTVLMLCLIAPSLRSRSINVCDQEAYFDTHGVTTPVTTTSPMGTWRGHGILSSMETRQSLTLEGDECPNGMNCWMFAWSSLLERHIYIYIYIWYYLWSYLVLICISTVYLYFFCRQS